MNINKFLKLKGFTLAELEAMRITKEQLAEKMGLNNIPGVQYDNALPVEWLENFLLMYVYKGMTHPIVTSTTFWVYLEGDIIGRPISGCTEVQELIDDFYK